MHLYKQLYYYKRSFNNPAYDNIFFSIYIITKMIFFFFTTKRNESCMESISINKAVF